MRNPGREFVSELLWQRIDGQFQKSAEKLGKIVSGGDFFTVCAKDRTKHSELPADIVTGKKSAISKY